MKGRVSLQTKILVLVLGTAVATTVLLAGIFSYHEFVDTENEIGTKALDTAKIVTRIPTLINAFYHENPEKTIQPLVEEIRRYTGAEYIVVGNTDSIRYSHPDPKKIGEKMVGGDNDQALIDGESYISKAVGSLGPALRGKAPVLGVDGEIIGIVSVGFMIEDIQSMIYKRLLKISGISLVVVIIGIIAGIILTRNIRKDTLGLEPYEIANLFKERDAILSSVHEGIIAVNKEGEISLMNNSAKKLAGIDDKEKLTIDQVFLDINSNRMLNETNNLKNIETVVNERDVIVNSQTFMQDNEVVGAVVSFRDKTELKELVNTLSEVRKYSEELRAQTHEYTNKLYVISGLLQLGNFNEAIDLIQTESEIAKNQNRILFEQIKDSTIQAILLGKIGLASESKIDLTIDPNCYLDKVPDYIQAVQLITIVGNLLDNAIEAVKDIPNGEVIFSATDLGNDIVIEVSNNGNSIPGKRVKQLFRRGFSTKQKHGRGYGLSLVKDTLEDLNGQIEVQNQPTGGVVFSIFIPKYQSLPEMKGVNSS
ncbi:ATP-binding protein [Oceanobacillus damuensis]|uniref:ATP-binding protein n=1 Tax=Oceanobacillus damuensis TaxID=937928 RepID=UPI00082E07E0|nr:sensor histidine kinase [Oceanobacillus damuensis]